MGEIYLTVTCPHGKMQSLLTLLRKWLTVNDHTTLQFALLFFCVIKHLTKRFSFLLFFSLIFFFLIYPGNSHRDYTSPFVGESWAHEDKANLFIQHTSCTKQSALQR